MKASELIKVEKPIVELYKEIQSANMNGEYRYQISPWSYISPVSIATLMNDGFKCYQVKDFCGLTTYVIEW